MKLIYYYLETDFTEFSIEALELIFDNVSNFTVHGFFAIIEK
jgi:hypothetical protein